MEAEGAAVEPGEIRRLRPHQREPGKLLGHEVGEERPVGVEATQQRVQPGPSVLEGGGVGEDADVAGSVADLLRKSVQVVDGVRSGYQQGRLQTGEIPGLRRGVQGERVLGAGDGQVGDELRTGQDQGCVDLVRDDSHSERPGQRGDRDELGPGVHRSGGVVGIGQQQDGSCRDVLGRGERRPERLHVESAVGSERCFDHLPVGVGDEGVERRVDGRAHHDGIARRRDQPQRLDDAHHHVGDDRGPLGLEAPHPQRSAANDWRARAYARPLG